MSAPTTRRMRLPLIAVLLPLLGAAPLGADDAAGRAPSPFVSVDKLGSSDAEIDAFLADRGWVRGECACNPAGGSLVVAEAEIAVAPNEIAFSEARLMATEEAYLTAVGDFARQDSVEIVKETVKTFTKDDLPREIETETGFGDVLDAVTKRLATASVAQLDRLIGELGGDTGDLPTLSFAERRKRLHDELLVESLTKASARMAGVGVFGVIERSGGALSNGSVALVVVRAPGFEDLGRQLRRGNDDATRGLPVDAVRARLSGHLASPDAMLGYFGVQPIKDAEGRYGLISFGMAAPQLVRGMHRDDISAEMQAARMSADLMSDGWLAQFASLAVTADRSEVKKKLRQRIDVHEGDGFVRSESGTDVGRLLSDVTKSVSSARIRGIQTIARWRADAPDTGHPYLGVVKYWSPAMAASAERLSEAYREGVARPAAASPSSEKPARRSVRSTGAFGEW